MTPVLEGSSKLGGVDGETERFVGGGANVHVGVLLNGRALAGCTVVTGEIEENKGLNYFI